MKPFSPSCEENKEPIFAVIEPLLRETKKVLEIGSGTGQHAVCFGQRLPQLTWQTSDLPENHRGILAWIEEAGLANVLPPLVLDAEAKTWPIQEVDAIFSANAVHIMGWNAVIGMFQGIGRVLADQGQLFLYGPFNYGGKFTSQSNEQFDAMLKAYDPVSGVRAFEAVNTLAQAQGLKLTHDIAMPANNRTLVWKKI